MFTVIDNVFDDFDQIRDIFNSSLFGMSDCFLKLVDNAADTILPIEHILKQRLGYDVQILGGAFVKGGTLSPKWKASVAVIPLSEADILGVPIKENNALIVYDFTHLTIPVPSILVMFRDSDENSTLYGN